MSKQPKHDGFEVHRKLLSSLNLLGWAVVLLLSGTIWYSLGSPNLFNAFESDNTVVEQVATTAQKENTLEDEVKNGIHVGTGLIYADGIELIQQNCLACHSAKLITQNKMSRERWKETIVWMQQTQKLWDLGVNEAKILDYLALNYAPEDKGRRANLKIEEWYEIQ